MKKIRKDGTRPITEKKLDEMLRKAIYAIGGEYLKFHSQVSTGWPDRFILLPCGSIWLIELKRPGGTLQPDQKHRRKWLIQRGFMYKFLDTLEKVRIFIATHLSKYPTIKVKNIKHV